MTIRFAGSLAAVFLLTVLPACDSPEKQKEGISIQFLSPPGGEAAKLPFSEAVRVGDVLYLSGQVGVLPGTTDLVKGGIREETKQTMESIRGVLERHGSSLDRVVKCTVFLADISEWPSMNEVYRTYFPDNPPAVWHLGLVYIAFGFAYIIYVTFFVKYLVTDGGYSTAGAGRLFMTVGWASLFCGLIWGTVSDIKAGNWATAGDLSNSTSCPSSIPAT
ncbi:MAG: Rid family hydrolase [PVC group bacterium]